MFAEEEEGPAVLIVTDEEAGLVFDRGRLNMNIHRYSQAHAEGMAGTVEMVVTPVATAAGAEGEGKGQLTALGEAVATEGTGEWMAGVGETAGREEREGIREAEAETEVMEAKVVFLMEKEAMGVPVGRVGWEAEKAAREGAAVAVVGLPFAAPDIYMGL